jgi:hypothetical protein
MGWAYAKKRHDWESGFESTQDDRARRRRKAATRDFRSAAATRAQAFLAAAATAANRESCASAAGARSPSRAPAATQTNAPSSTKQRRCTRNDAQPAAATAQRVAVTAAIRERDDRARGA